MCHHPQDVQRSGVLYLAIVTLAGYVCRLLNVIVEPKGYWAVVGEVQIHLLTTLQLKEAVIHRMYEITRASRIESLVIEAGTVLTGALFTSLTTIRTVSVSVSDRFEPTVSSTSTALPSAS